MPLPRHRFNEEDASAELAHCIAQYLDSSDLYKEWCISPLYPGHFLGIGGGMKQRRPLPVAFLILPKFVAPITSVPERAPTFHYEEKIDAHDPQFFEKLAERLLQIQGQDGTSTIWRPKNA